MPTKDLINTGPLYTRVSTGEVYTPQKSLNPIENDVIDINRYPGFDYTPFQENLPEGMSIEETQQFGGPEYAQGEFQSGWEQLAKTIPRIGVKVASEVAKLPGYLVGGINWGITSGFNAKEISTMVDNEWIKGVDEVEQATKDSKWMNIFKTYKESTGSFSDQVFNPAFLASEGADGIGFFLSMLVPGQALKAAKLGEGALGAFSKTASKLVKPGTKMVSNAAKATETVAEVATKGATLADKINGGLAVTVNTLYESGAEAGETYKNVLNQLSHDIDPVTGEDRGPKVNPVTGQQYTEDEIKQLAGTNAANVMKSNFAILFASNVVMEQMLFHSFDNSMSFKNVIKGGIVKEGDKLALATAKPSLIGNIGIKVGAGIFSEGLYEEGAQAAVSDYFTKRATGEEPDPDSYSGVLGGIINTYLDNFSNIEAQKSMFLGAILGSFAGGVGGYRSHKTLEKQLFGGDEKNPGKFASFFGAKPQAKTEGYINLLNESLNARYSDITELAVKNEKGEYIYNSDGTIKWDPIKVSEYVKDRLHQKVMVDTMAKAALEGNREAYDYLKANADFQYMLPFLTEEGGLEALKVHIEDLAKLDEARQIMLLGKANAQSIEEIKSDLLKKANKYEKVVKNIQAQHTNANLFSKLKYNKTDIEDVERFIARVLSAKKQSYFNQSFLPDQIAKLNADNGKLNPEIAAEKQQIDKNNSQIEQYKKDLEASNKGWGELTDNKYLQKELDIFLAAQKQLKKNIADITEAIKNNATNPATSFTETIYNETNTSDTFYDPSKARDRDIIHQGTIEVTLLDADGKEYKHTEIVNNVSEEVDLKYKVEKLLASGKLLVSRVMSDGKKVTTVINPDGTISLNGKSIRFKYKVLENGEQAKLRNQNNTVREAYASLINEYEGKLVSAMDRMSLIKDKIQILETKIQEALKDSHTKSGKLKRFRLGSKNGKAVWMDMLEMSVELNKLKEKNKELSENSESYAKSLDNLKANLDSMVNSDTNNLDLVTEAVELFKSTVDSAYSVYMTTREQIRVQEQYLRRLFSTFKGVHTSFFNTFNDRLTKIVNEIRKDELKTLNATERNKKLELNISKYRGKLNKLSKQLYNERLIEQNDELNESSSIILFRFRDQINQSYNDIINSNLPIEEQQKQIFELIADVKLSIDELFSEEDAAEMKSMFDKKVENLIDKIEVTEQELQSLYNKKNEEGDLYSESRKNQRLYTRILKKIHENYSVLFKDQLDQEFDIEDKQEQITETPEVAVEAINTFIEPETLATIEDFDGIPKHPFKASRFDFLHSTGNYSATNSDEYFRWMGYVYTNKDTSPDKETNNIIKTYTYNQVKALSQDNIIRQQIKFYDGTSEKTVDEIKSPNDIVLNDIKIVVVKRADPTTPYLVDESGKSGKDYIVYSQLPLPNVVRESGHDVFTYEKRLKDISNSLALNPKIPKEDISILAEKQLKDEIAKETAEYNEFRANANKDNQFLKITSRNSGKKVDTSEWNDVKEVSFDYLNPENYEVTKTDGSKQTVITVNGVTMPARNGFTYLISQNSPRVITPKTLEQTGEIDQVVDLLIWLMNNPTAPNWTAVEDFVKQITYFLYQKDVEAENFKYRLFLQKKDNKAKKSPFIRSIVFGENEFTKEEFLSDKQNQDLFKEFLKTKYHNIDSKSLKDGSDYTEYVIKDGELKPIRHEGKKGGYRLYLFGTGVSKGVVNLNKIHTDPVTYARDPQYINSSLNFVPIGEKVVRETSSDLKKETLTDTKVEESDKAPGGMDRNTEVSDYSAMGFLKRARENGERIGIVEAKRRAEEYKAANPTTDENLPFEPDTIAQPASNEEISQSGTSELDAMTAPDLFSSEAVALSRENLTAKYESIRTSNPEKFARLEAKGGLEAFITDMTDDSVYNRPARTDSDYEVGNTTEMKKWLKEKFPHIPVFLYNELIDGKNWGQFKKGIVVSLSKLAEVGTEFHEGWHIVSQTFTSDEERESLYNEVRKRLKGSYTNDELEEILAEEFREFMLSKGDYVFGKNQKLQKTLFTRILDNLKSFITELFGVEFSDDIINKFKEIDNTTYSLDGIKKYGTFIDDIDIPGRFISSKEAADNQIKCKGTAANGMRNNSFTKGSEWSISKDLKGYPSHANGGVDLNVNSSGIFFKHSSGKKIKAKHGLVLPKLN